MDNLTNFAALTSEQKTMWSMRFWKEGRDKSFLARFEGTSSDSMIQRITELKQTEKGSRAVITLVHDLENDGIAGDRFLEGNEEAMLSSDQVIEVDQLRHAVRHRGRMADQKSVVNFRSEAMNKLSFWLGNRWDQMAILHLSGISYAYHTNGALRTNSQLQLLEFAADAAKAPTANRHFQWDATNGLIKAGDGGFGTANIAAADTPTYELIVNLKTAAHNAYIRPIRTSNGVEYYNVFMHPNQIQALKLDADFKQAYREALPRSPDNPIFKGTDVIWLDGLAIYPLRYVYNTTGAASGSKWGAGGAVNGARGLLCGAQALAKADIGNPRWVEKEFDFENQPAISAGKISGFLRPQFTGVDSGQLEDFSSLVFDTAL